MVKEDMPGKIPPERVLINGQKLAKRTPGGKICRQVDIRECVVLCKTESCSECLWGSMYMRHNKQLSLYISLHCDQGPHLPSMHAPEYMTRCLIGHRYSINALRVK